MAAFLVFFLMNLLIHVSLSRPRDYVSVEWQKSEKYKGHNYILLDGLVDESNDWDKTKRVAITPEAQIVKITYDGKDGEKENEFRLQAKTGDPNVVSFKKIKRGARNAVHKWSLDEFADMIIAGHVKLQEHEKDADTGRTKLIDSFEKLQAKMIAPGRMNDAYNDAYKHWENQYKEAFDGRSDMNGIFGSYLHSAYDFGVFEFGTLANRLEADEKKEMERLYRTFIDSKIKTELKLKIDDALREKFRQQHKNKWEDINMDLWNEKALDWAVKELESKWKPFLNSHYFTRYVMKNTHVPRNEWYRQIDDSERVFKADSGYEGNYMFDST